MSGGFIGKCGQVVGQHWHNIRYVRTYVVPHNPQTPLQQGNRALFAVATRLAQEAFNINKGDPSWASEGVPEFSMRVKTAMRRLIRGLPPAQALPLYPDSSPVSTLATFNTVNTSGALDVIQCSLTAGDDSSAAFGALEIYHVDMGDGTEYDFSRDYTYNPATKVLTGFTVFKDALAQLYSCNGVFKTSSGAVIPGSEISTAGNGDSVFLWYDHAAGTQFANVISITYSVGATTAQFQLNTTGVPAGVYHGLAQGEVSTSGGATALFDQILTGVTLTGAADTFVTVNLDSSITSPSEWICYMALVPDTGLRKGFAFYGAETI